MSRKQFVRGILFGSTILAMWILGAGCARSGHEHGHEHEGHAVWFVHATDPHIYLSGADDEKKKRQQELDEKALSDFLRDAGSVPEAPAFLLITGDFGVDPCLMLTEDAATKAAASGIAKDCLGEAIDKKKRDDEVEKVAGLLGASPVRDIYFVAGNNDLPMESADDAALVYFNQFFDDVQKKILVKKSEVQLHNLTACYASNGSAASCYADIADTPYRMIGFPSQSLKNKEKGSEGNLELQLKQAEVFQGLLKQASQAGKHVLVVTHIPEIDDPFFLAQDRYAAAGTAEAKDTDKDNARSKWSTWNVKKKLLDEWEENIASNSVAGVFAGHLHDAHKEVYRRPYAWSSVGDGKRGYHKLYLAPPLSVKNQDASPIQARGFSLVGLTPDSIGTRFFWYDSEARSFAPESSWKQAGRHRGHRFASRCVEWLWGLDPKDSSLERAAVLFIALLTAFLTVVAIWQIPPTDNPLAKKPMEDKEEKLEDKDKKDGTKGTADSSPFTTRFGKTVVAGLGGLVVTEVTKSLGNQPPSGSARWYYFVAFIFFFFVLLLSLNFFRALAEALRARVAVVHYPLARPSRYTDTAKARFFDWLFYWFMRTVHWIFSLRVPALTFVDTFVNLIQGKNQTTTRAFQEVIIDQQRTVMRAADAIRKNLNDLIESKVQDARVRDARTKPKADEEPKAKVAGEVKSTPDEKPEVLPVHVRVNISVLSDDQSRVFYISRTPRSSLLPFQKRSVAWVSVVTGQIRWYDKNYEGKGQKIILLDNKKGTIAGAEDLLMLAAHYQDRQDDYEAFVIFPVPYPQRGYDAKYRKGAIHVSFGSDEDFHAIWKPPVPRDAILPDKELMTYPEPTQNMLYAWCQEKEIEAALNTSIVALGELLRGFNEFVYQSYIEANKMD